MPEQLPWFPFYVRDFTRSRLVRSSPPEHIGIYVLLLCEQWEGGALPEDLGDMAQLIGVDGNAMANAWQSLCDRFELTDAGWVNSRLREVREEQEKKHRVRSRAGKKGAKARWNKGENGKRMANASDSHSDRNATAMEEEESEKEVEVETESTSTSLRSVDAENANGSLSGGEVLGWWLEHQEQRPPDKDVAKQGAAAKRIASRADRNEVIQAFVGIEQLYPHSAGEPWDLFDLDKKFSKALQAAHNHPEIKRRKREQEILESISRPGGFL